MMFSFFHKFHRFLLIAAFVIFGLNVSAQQSAQGESLVGFYAREGNNSSSSSTAGNNIYIKFFEDRWIAMLYIPYPYASSVNSATINKVFDAAIKETSTSAFIRGTFGQLTEKATLQVERYGYLEDRIVFECGSLAPCTIRLGEDYLDLIKPGVINEHIIKYNHMATE